MEDCQLHLPIKSLEHPLLALIAFSSKKSQEVILCVCSLLHLYVCLHYKIIVQYAWMFVTYYFWYFQSLLSNLLRQLLNLKIMHTRAYLLNCTVLKNRKSLDLIKLVNEDMSAQDCEDQEKRIVFILKTIFLRKELIFRS